MDRLPISAYLTSSCELADPPMLFAAVYVATQGNPCPGCAYDSHGSKCKARAELFRKPESITPIVATQETVRDAAKRMGVSISEVRRMRKEPK